MEESYIFKLFSEGKIYFPSKEIDAATLPWYEHPNFKGVFLKNLITGEETDGAFSCHIVKVEGGCDAGNHSHEEWEFNEAISGEGTFVIGNKKLPLKPGLSYATPPGISHIVSAPEEDIYLLAKFVPGL